MFEWLVTHPDYEEAIGVCTICGALIGFAGPRVIEQTIRQKLPEGFQRSEFLLEHGMIDAIVHRKEMKDFIAKSLKFFLQ